MLNQLRLAALIALANLSGVPGGSTAAAPHWFDHWRRPECRIDDEDDDPDRPDQYLYVWAGDELGVVRDFLAVVDFDQKSRRYGQVITTASAPTSGNEAHHCNLSSDGNVIVCGGLLSLLKDQDGIFFFDVSSPRRPRLIGSSRPRLSSITDDPVPLPGGGFLITMMGSESGGAPGRVVEYDRHLRLVREWPKNPPSDGFNPHGISIRPEANLMITSDFINPVTTLIGYPGPLGIRGSIRVWNLAGRRIVQSIPIPPAVGTMDCKLIPGDPRLGAYTAGMFDEGGAHLYYIDTQAGTYAEAFNFDSLLPGGMPQILAMTDDGDRLVVPIASHTDAGPAGGLVALLDITDRTQARVVSVVDLGPGSAPHNLLLTSDQKRVVVTDYFLDEGSAGKIHFDGDDRVHVLKLRQDKLALDANFDLNFSTAFPGLRARPHGIAVK